MTAQALVEDSASELSTLFGCGFALPTDEFRTVFTNFPGANCTPQRAPTGEFFSTISLYRAGKKEAEFAMRRCNESGVLHADIDDVASLKGENLDGILVMEHRHPEQIPLDMYMFHTHRKTGIYVSYPIATYMGNKIYGGAPGQVLQMENTLFWPGVISNDHSESCVAVLNPYNVNLSYQFTIFGRAGKRAQSEVFRTKSLSYAHHRVEELFPDICHSSEQDGRISLCIAGQYKLICYFMLRNRRTGTYSTIDHMHTYCIV